MPGFISGSCVFGANANVAPVPAIKTNRRTTSLGGAALHEGQAAVVERPAGCTYPPGRFGFVLRPLEIPKKVFAGYAVDFPQTRRRKLTRPHQLVDELIRHAQHFGDVFKTQEFFFG